MTQLTISSLISELTKIQDEHGDLPVVLRDADTSWGFKLESKHLKIDDETYLAKVVKIKVGYYDSTREQEKDSRNM